MIKDDFKSPLKPLEDYPPKPLTPAPAVVAFLCAWLGLMGLIGGLAVPFVPGSRNPTGELTHAVPYSPADWVLAITMYTCVIAIFLGIVVLWQMRRHPRPLEAALGAQRLQALVGIVLALVSAGFIYAYVALRGPGGHL